MDLVILSHGQMTRTTLELAPLSPNYHTNGKTFELSTDLTCIAPFHDGYSAVLGSNSRHAGHESVTLTTNKSWERKDISLIVLQKYKLVAKSHAR
ncbi:hypothetical protein TNCV_2804701 [Trichonephila clavipes]|nr:hypothetical protein TNCV_2804701 [Trichonephila clavipes]